MRHVFLVGWFLIVGMMMDGGAAMQASYSQDENDAAWILSQRLTARPVTPPPVFSAPAVRSPLTPRRMVQSTEGTGSRRAAARICSTNITQMFAEEDKMSAAAEKMRPQEPQSVSAPVQRAPMLNNFFMAPPLLFSGMPGVEGWAAGPWGRNFHPYYAGSMPVYNAPIIGNFVREPSVGVGPAFSPFGMMRPLPMSPIPPSFIPLAPDFGSTPLVHFGAPVASVALGADAPLKGPVAVKKVSKGGEGVHKKTKALKESRILNKSMYEVLDQFQRENEQDVHTWSRINLRTFLKAQPASSDHASTIKTLLEASGQNKHFNAMQQTLNKRKMRLIESQTQAPWTEESKETCTKLYREFEALQSQQKLPVTTHGAVKFINAREGKFFVTARAREFLGSMIRREHGRQAD